MKSQRNDYESDSKADRRIDGNITQRKNEAEALLHSCWGSFRRYRVTVTRLKCPQFQPFNPARWSDEWTAGFRIAD